MNQQHSRLELSPEEIAFAANQQAAQMKAFVTEMNANTAIHLYSTLLNKWMEQHELVTEDGNGEVAISVIKPSANDLKWLAKMSVHYAPFLIEALGMIKIQDPKLEALDGISETDMFGFDHLESGQ